MGKDWWWIVYNRREGIIKSSKSKVWLERWRKRHRPRGTRLVFMCIPPREA